MKSALISCTDSTQNTNTISFLSKPADSICDLSATERQDSFIICTPNDPPLPYTRLPENGYFNGNILFTIIFMILFACARLLGKDLLPMIVQAVFSRKKASLLQTENATANTGSYFSYLFLSFIIIGGGYSFFTNGTYWDFSTLYLCGGLFIYHIIFIGIIRLIGWLFNSSQIATEFIVHIWIFNINTGLFISPLIIALTFVPQSSIEFILYTTAAIIALLFIIKIICWIKILLSNRVSIFYMILYLCALEIIPLLVLYKVVILYGYH